MKTIAVGLTGILLGNLLAFAPITPIVLRSVSTGATDRPDEQPVSPDARREWALGCAAVLTERNHDSHTLLSGCPRTEAEKAGKRRLLSQYWDINNREEFFKTLAWVDHEGHRADFEKLARLVSHVPEKEYQRLLEKADNPEVRNKLRVVRENYRQLGSKSLYGWDYSRGICLCRWAYLVGFISEGEAWERIMPMALLLQETFDSWEDLGRNYLIGRRFWSHNDTQENGWECEDAVQRLLDMRSSPWNRYPWDMKLKDAGRKKDAPPKPEPKERKEGTDLVAAAP